MILWLEAASVSKTILGMYPAVVSQQTVILIRHFIIQLMHNVQFVNTIKIIQHLKVLQHVSNHRGSIIREPCTMLGYKLEELFYRA